MQSVSQHHILNMIATVDWIRTWFESFNQEYFDGKLPLPDIGITKASTRLGQMSYKRAYRWGRTKYYDFKISLTTYYDMTDQQAKNVLLHEMIHYAIAYTGLKDTSSHGVIFRGMADNLNRKYGWDIHISTSTKGWKVNDAIKTKREKSRKATGKTTVYLMLSIETKDGKCYLSRVNPKFAYRLELQISHIPDIVSHQWHTTSDTEFFEGYPMVRSLRGKRISKTDFNKLQNVLTEFKLQEKIF